MKITHTRTEITITRIGPPCPYCKKRVVISETCGHPECQYKHHIILMRKRRKTDQVRPSRRKKI